MPDGSDSGRAKAERQKRLAEALRANLKRRKEHLGRKKGTKPDLDRDADNRT